MSDKEFEKRWGGMRELVAHMMQGGQPHCPDADVQWYPATDAFVVEDEFVVRMDLSGVRREDLQMVLEKEFLHVRGVRREPDVHPRPLYHNMEIAKGPFGRTVRLPGTFAGGEARAAYADGILEVRVRERRRRRGGAVTVVITEDR